MNRIADLISRGDPAALAIVDGARRVTYAQLDGLVDETVAELRRRRTRSRAIGSRCSWAPGSTSSATTSPRRGPGWSRVPLNPAYTEPERDFILTDSGARAADHAPPA